MININCSSVLDTFARIIKNHYTMIAYRFFLVLTFSTQSIYLNYS